MNGKVLVSRTCTEIFRDDTARDVEHSSLTLRELRALSVYVLLGDPGSGKSTVFEVECDELGEEAELITARDFLSSDTNSHPEWRDRTLFIDGLDEIRAGQTDARTPFDAIRGQLDSLGQPRFRISCREADWLGDNDRKRLARVSPDSEVKILRLDPLTDSDIETLLNHHLDVDDAGNVMAQARELSLERLLTNPLSLKLLATAFAGSDTEVVPTNRLETFELACRQMTTEHNEEHNLAGQPFDPDQILDGAGRLCAFQLISGADGFSIDHGKTTTNYILLNRCDAKSQELSRRAVCTRLFAGQGGYRRFAPVHRHIAEFLGARYLARVIDDGLTARRVVSLIVGEDGGVVTELRGLSAWLAVHSREARSELIERDSIGVGMYGDIRGFPTEDKQELLQSLHREVTRLDYSVNPACFGPIASPDMESILQDILTEPNRDRDHQLTAKFILQILQYSTPLPSLSQTLLDIIYDDSRYPQVDKHALYAYIHHMKDSPDRDDSLVGLLADIRNNKISDPDDELTETLLAQLYPQVVPPSKVWDHLVYGGVGNAWKYHKFWINDLLERSSEDDIAELLDELYQRLPDLKTALEGHNLERLPLELLDRGLSAVGDELEPARLYNWLSAGSMRDWKRSGNRLGTAKEFVNRIRAWLEARPQVQKAVFLEGLTRCQEDDLGLYSFVANRFLYGSTLPPDFGLWSLEHAVKLLKSHPQISEYLLAEAFRSYSQQTHDEGLSRSTLIEHTRGHEVLERQLADMLDLSTSPTLVKQTRQVETYQEEDQRRQREWLGYVRSNIEALRDNRAAPVILHQLGEVYFRSLPGQTDYDEPTQRISALLGDGDLIEAALRGLRGTVSRDDIPEFEEIIRLYSESKFPCLTLPFLAGMDEISRVTPEQLDCFSARQIRTALAFYFSYGRNDKAEWYRRWLDSHPDLLSEVLIKWAKSAIHGGKESLLGLCNLAFRTDHAPIARRVSLTLLRTFPVRCKLSQIQALDCLLWAALQHCDKPSFEKLIQEKLSRKTMHASQRVHWLAAGTVIDPEVYGQTLGDFVGDRDGRIRQLVEFLCPPILPLQEPTRLIIDKLEISTLELFVRLVGPSFGPVLDSFGIYEIQESQLVGRMIEQLSSFPGEDAAQALDHLGSDSALVSWRDTLIGARSRQRVIHRDFTYRCPDIERIHRTLSNQSPANAADLAGLVSERLEKIAARIRRGNTNDWRQYWNVDSYDRPLDSKPENSCRDMLLSDLRQCLPKGVDAQPEGQYAGNKRADIRVSYQDFNVPVEIKKSNHRDLRSALRCQLIKKYTSDPATGGYGIYLVFWFGNDSQPTPHDDYPATASELREQLEAELTAEEARKISVRVIDVQAPSQSAPTSKSACCRL